MDKNKFALGGKGGVKNCDNNEEWEANKLF